VFVFLFIVSHLQKERDTNVANLTLSEKSTTNGCYWKR